MDGAYGRETWQEFVAKSKPEQADPSCCLSYFAFQVTKRGPSQTIGIFQSYSQFMVRRFISLPFNLFFSLEAVVVFLDAT
jgi:hypothetical protein